MINGKAVLSSGKKNKKKSIQEHTHSHNTHTHFPPHTHIHTHSLTHTQVTKHHKQTLYETSDEHKLICLTIKLHTVQPHERISSLSQWMASTQGGEEEEESCQRTLAMKQQPGVKESTGRTKQLLKF